MVADPAHVLPPSPLPDTTTMPNRALTFLGIDHSVDANYLHTCSSEAYTRSWATRPRARRRDSTASQGVRRAGERPSAEDDGRRRPGSCGGAGGTPCARSSSTGSSTGEWWQRLPASSGRTGQRIPAAPAPASPGRRPARAQPEPGRPEAGVLAGRGCGGPGPGGRGLRATPGRCRRHLDAAPPLSPAVGQRACPENGTRKYKSPALTAPRRAGACSRDRCNQ